MTAPSILGTSTTVTWSGGTSGSIAVPSGFNPGELLVMIVNYDNTGGTGPSGSPTASGWTLPAGGSAVSSNNHAGLAVLWRKAQAGDTSWTVSWGSFDSHTGMRATIYRTNADAFDTVNIAVQDSGASITVGALTTAANDELLLFAGILYSFSGGAAPSGMTLVDHLHQGFTDSVTTAEATQATAGTSISPTYSTSSPNCFGGMLIALKPAPPPPVSISPTATSVTATSATPTITATKNRRVSPSAASLATTRGTPTVSVSKVVTPGAAALATTPATPKIGTSVIIAPAAASLSATPSTPTIGTSATVAPAAASTAATPATPTIGTSATVDPDAAPLTLTADTPNVGTSTLVAPDAASATATPATPHIGTSAVVAPDATSASLTAESPIIGPSATVAPDGASLTATPETPVVTVNHIIAPDAESLTATPETPIIGTSATIAPESASLATSTGAPTIGIGHILHPAHATAALTPGTPLIGHSGRVAPSAAALAVTLDIPIIGASRTIAPDAASITVTLETPAIGTSRRIAPPAASLSLTGGTLAIRIGAYVRPAEIDVSIMLAVPVVVGYMPVLVTVPQYADQLTNALRGRYGPARYDYVFELRKADYTFVADITPYVIADSATINLNNDRAVCRQLTISLDATRSYHGAKLDLDVLSDHIVPRMRLHLPRRVIGWQTQIDVPMGLYQLTWPTKNVSPNSITWDIEASDLCMQLQQDGPDTVYTVDAGVDCITGTNAVSDILTAQGLRYSLVASGVITAVAKSYDPGTPWLTILNDLLGQANYYALTFDRTGIARTKPISDLTTQPTNATYSSTDSLLIPWQEQGDMTMFANKVVITVNDPSVAPMHSVAINSDPDNSVSTIALGRTITKFLTSGAVADQATLDARAFAELQQDAAFYRTADFLTVPDPLREPRELYLIQLPDASDGQVWQVRNWTMDLKTEKVGPMKHTISRIEKLVAA